MFLVWDKEGIEEEEDSILSSMFRALDCDDSSESSLKKKSKHRKAKKDKKAKHSKHKKRKRSSSSESTKSEASSSEDESSTGTSSSSSSRGKDSAHFGNLCACAILKQSYSFDRIHKFTVVLYAMLPSENMSK